MGGTVGKILIVLMALALSGSLDAASKMEKKYVARSGIRLLSSPSSFSKTVAKLDAGQLVLANSQSTKGYHAVMVKGGKSDGKKGYLSRMALQPSRPRIVYSTKRSQDASAEEVAAATKGFNKQVEAKYRKGNAKLDYDQLDRLIERSDENTDSKSHQTFRKEGKLGEYAEAAQ